MTWILYSSGFIVTVTNDMSMVRLKSIFTEDLTQTHCAK